MKYKDVVIPRLNGRPQMWIETWGFSLQYERIRIIYPDGRVEYLDLGSVKLYFVGGCTTSYNQLAAIKKCVDYFFSARCDEKRRKLEFLGYL